MRQLFYVEPGRVEWRESPAPRLEEETDALVRPLAVATCDIDTGLIQGRVPFPGPFPLGHEGVGEVIEVGTKVAGVKVGQRVLIPFQISCGQCSRCRRGLTASCLSVNRGAMYGLEPFGGPWGGFLADAVRVPWADHMLLPLPQGIDPVSVASLSDNIPDGWRCIAPFVEDPASASVLVVAGSTPSIPFYAIQVAKALEVGQIDYLDFHGEDPRGCEKAAREGAQVLPGPDAVHSERYSVTVCSVGDPDALKLSLRAAEPDGACVSNTVFFQGDVPLPMFAMYTRGVRLITGRVNARALMPSVLDLVELGQLDPGTVTDEVVAWDDAAEALTAGPRKLVIRR